MPEGARTLEGPQGGNYYIPPGDDPVRELSDIANSDMSDSEKTEQMSDVVSETSGIENVDLSGFDASQAEAVSSSITRLSEKGYTDGIQSVSATPTDSMGERNAAANYDPFTASISFDPSTVSEENVSDWGSSGFLAGDTIDHMVAHEVGHHMHFTNEVDGRSAGMQAQTQEIPEEVRAQVAEEISVYAAENANELVAELFAMQVSGDGMPAGYGPAYEQFGGGSINE